MFVISCFRERNMQATEALERLCMPKLDFPYLSEEVLRYMTHPLDEILYKSSQTFWHKYFPFLLEYDDWHSQLSNLIADQSHTKNSQVYHSSACFVFFWNQENLFLTWSSKEHWLLSPSIASVMSPLYSLSRTPKEAYYFMTQCHETEVCGCSNTN